MNTWLYAFVLLIFWPLAAMAEECQLVKLETVPLLGRDVGLPMVTVKINGTDRKFLIATGTAFSSLSESVAAELGLPQRAIEGWEIYSSSKRSISKYVVVDEMKIGQITAKLGKLIVVKTGQGIDGALAPDFLKQYDLDFDFAANTLTFMSQNHCPGRVVYWTDSFVDIPFTLGDNNHIIVPVTLDGKSVRASIDTALSETFLSANTANYVFGLKEGSASLEAVPGASESSTVRFKAQFSQLVLEGITIRSPTIYIRSDEIQKQFDRKHLDKGQFDPNTAVSLDRQDLEIGMNILSKLHLYIAYKERKLYVSSATAH